MASIRLYGDEQRAIQLVGRAKQLMTQLHFSMELGNLKSSLKIVDADGGATIQILSSRHQGFWDDIVNIIYPYARAEEVQIKKFLNLFVADMFQSVQEFEMDFVKSKFDPGGPLYRQSGYDLSAYQGKVYSTDWFLGHVYVFNPEGVFQSDEQFTQKVQFPGGTMLKQICVKSNRIIGVSNALAESVTDCRPNIFDLNFNYLYSIVMAGGADPTKGACGLEIVDDQIFVAWYSGTSFVGRYTLSDGTPIQVLETDLDAGTHYESLAEYRGILYGVDPEKARVVKWSLSEMHNTDIPDFILPIIEKVDISEHLPYVPPDGFGEWTGPAGIVVGDEGIFITYVKRTGDHLNGHTYKAEVHHFDLNFNHLRTIGDFQGMYLDPETGWHYNATPGNFIAPYGVELMEV